MPWQPIPIPNCGANQEGSCDDKPGLITLVNSVVRSQHIDRKKIFVTGASKGGDFAVELMCSPRTNLLFRGFGVVSATLWNAGPVENASTNTCRSFNRDSSVIFVAGEADGFVPYNGHGLGSHYSWGQEHGVAYVAAHYGCKARPTTIRFGTSGSLLREDYGSCAKRFRAVSLIAVPGGGHAYAVDGVQGLNSEAAMWSFWTSH